MELDSRDEAMIDGGADGGVQIDDGVELKVTDGRVYRCQLCADAGTQKVCKVVRDSQRLPGAEDSSLGP